MTLTEVKFIKDAKQFEIGFPEVLNLKNVPDHLYIETLTNFEEEINKIEEDKSIVKYFRISFLGFLLSIFSAIITLGITVPLAYYQRTYQAYCKN